MCGFADVDRMIQACSSAHVFELPTHCAAMLKARAKAPGWTEQGAVGGGGVGGGRKGSIAGSIRLEPRLQATLTCNEHGSADHIPVEGNWL